eukprot:gene28572-20151_t
MNQVLANISAWSNVYVSLMGTLDLFASASAATAERVLNFTSWVEPVCPGKEGTFYTGPD